LTSIVNVVDADVRSVARFLRMVSCSCGVYSSFLEAVVDSVSFLRTSSIVGSGTGAGNVVVIVISGVTGAGVDSSGVTEAGVDSSGVTGAGVDSSGVTEAGVDPDEPIGCFGGGSKCRGEVPDDAVSRTF
jgi:hypothetical protein